MASADVINTLIAEAGGEGEKGLIAAAWAIAQRAAARGQTLDQVVKSGFDGYSNPGSGARRAQQDPKTRASVERILNGVVNGTTPNPVPRADHFVSGSATPSWAKNMDLVATIGGHRFYASGNVPQSAIGHPVPQAEVPEVATLLDTRRTAPNPADQSLDLRLMRNRPPTNLVSDTMTSAQSVSRPTLQAALNARVAKPTNALSARSSGEINATVQGLPQDQALAAALTRRTSPQLTDPGMIDKTASSLRQDPALSAALSRPQPSPRVSAAAVPQSAIERGEARTVGQPPTTRTVQSVRMPALNIAPPRVTVSTPSTVPQSNIDRGAARPPAPKVVPQSHAGQETGAARTQPATTRVATAAAPKVDPVGKAPDWNSFYDDLYGASPDVGEIPPQTKFQMGMTGGTVPVSDMARKAGQNMLRAAPDRLAANVGTPAGQGLAKPQVYALGAGLSPNVNALGYRVTDPANPAVNAIRRAAPTPVTRGIARAPVPAWIATMAPKAVPVIRAAAPVAPMSASGGGNGPSVAAPATFSGTSTGNSYTAGQVYSNGNGTYRANPDGSFTNTNTGRTIPGSSGGSSSASSRAGQSLSQSGWNG